MNAVAPNPRKELNNKHLPPRRVREIGGSMEKPLGEMDNYEVTEKPFKPFGMPSKGRLYFGMPPMEISQKALDLSGNTTRVGLNLAKGLGEGFLDVFKMIKGEQAKPKTPEARAKEQKTQQAEAQSRFLHQKTAGTEQMISNEAKRRMQESASSIVNGQFYTQQETKAKGHQEAYRVHTAVSIARERSEKIAEQKRKRYNSGIGSPAKKGSRMGGVSSSGAKSNMLTTAEDQNMNHAG